MPRLILLLLAVIGLMVAFARLGRMPPQQRAKYVKLILLWGGGIALLALIFTGKLHPLFAAIGALFPWISRIIMMRSAYQMFSSWQGPARGAKPGQSSSVNTKFLKMTLDHDSGEISGIVTTGDFSGRALDDLSVEELAELLRECRRRDRQSVALIESYIDKMRADEWERHDQERGDDPGDGEQSDETMGRAEALEILGLTGNPTKEEIIEAHRTLMQRNHPDRGGTNWLASRINRAKEVLLSQCD